MRYFLSLEVESEFPFVRNNLRNETVYDYRAWYDAYNKAHPDSDCVLIIYIATSKYVTYDVIFFSSSLRVVWKILTFITQNIESKHNVKY